MDYLIPPTTVTDGDDRQQQTSSPSSVQSNIVETATTNTTPELEEEKDVFYSQSSIDISTSTTVMNDKVIFDGILRTTIHVPVNRNDRKQMLIVLVDKSASIRYSWPQIQATLLSLFQIVFNHHQEIILEIIYFNNTAYQMKWTKENYKELIQNERPCGKTCFAATFNLCADLLRTYYKKETGFKSDLYYDPKTDASIILLTDGSHTTVRDQKSAFANLKTLIKSITCASITVHTMGFTENSRFNDLDGIRRTLGTKEGVYQYCEPTDGPHALQEKLRFIFGLALTSSDTASVQVSFNEKDNIKFLDTNSHNSSPFVVALDSNGDAEINASIYIQADSPALLGEQKVNEITTQIEPLEITIKVGDDITTINHIIPTRPNTNNKSTGYLLHLVRIETALKSLMEILKKHNDKNLPTDANKKEYSKKILDLQKELRDIDNGAIFSFEKTVRQEIIAFKTNCQNLSSKLSEIVNQWLKSDWNAVAAARMADISYQFMFRNAGRQRRATAKVTRNALAMMSDAQRLAALEVEGLDELDDIEDPAEKELLENSRQLFSCTLSLSNWTELVEEKDVLGFGLAVQRPEAVIDDPTQLRIVDYSTTFIGKSSIEDALALEIAAKGQDKATGGFDGSAQVDKVASAIRGRGREPINSWLPLYIHPLHWKTASCQLRSIMGYFVTLDPMAYQYDQLNALFLVLGTIVSRDMGERQLLLVLQLIRTCREIAAQFKYFPHMKNQLNALLHKPLYHIAEQPKNIFVVLGYILVHTDEELKEIIPDPHLWTKLWDTVLESAIRRSCFGFFKDKEQNIIDQFVLNVINGEKNGTPNSEEELSIDQLFNNLSNYESKKDIKIEPDTRDLEEYFNITIDPVTRPDRADESFKNIQGKSSFSTIMKMSNLLETKGYPTLEALYNCLQFTFAWRRILNGSYRQADTAVTDPAPYNAFDEMDKRYGISPNEWINYIKGVFASNQSKVVSIGNYLETVYQYFPPSTIDQSTRYTSHINKMRAMITQGVLYRTNKVATQSVLSGVYSDTTKDPLQCISSTYNQVQLRREEVYLKMERALEFSSKVSNGIKSSDLDSFLFSIPLHSDPFFPEFFLHWKSAKTATVPFAREKLVLFLSNVRIIVDSHNNFRSQMIKPFTWKPSKPRNNALRLAWGAEAYNSIMSEVAHKQYIHEKQEETEEEEQN